MSTSMNEDNNNNEEMILRHVESEVISDIYKSSMNNLSSRHQHIQSLAKDYNNTTDPSSYRSYIDELRKEYKQEKDERVRNKSFEYNNTTSNIDMNSTNNLQGEKKVINIRDELEKERKLVNINNKDTIDMSKRDNTDVNHNKDNDISPYKKKYEWIDDDDNRHNNHILSNNSNIQVKDPFDDKDKVVYSRYDSRLYHTDRNQKPDRNEISPDIPPTNNNIDYMSILGRCKRLENENQILLKNNSELRRENIELMGRNKDSSVEDLKKKILMLEEKNRKLENQLISPILPHNNNHFIDPISSMNNISKIYTSNTDRYNNNSNRKYNTKIKFADSVLNMVKQLVDINDNDEEKTAWKVLKNVINEYVRLKKTNISTSIDDSSNRYRNRSEEHNKWKNRSYN